MGSRFAPGGARPAPATVYAQPRSELFPGVDRPTIVLWLGVALIIASELADNGPTRAILNAATGKPYQAQPNGLKVLLLEGGLIFFLWLLALASDTSGNFAVLLVVALWVVFILRHPNAVMGVLNLSNAVIKG